MSKYVHTTKIDCTSNTCTGSCRGDLALLDPGEIIPCDGIFLSGHNMKCDESAATGETDAIKKAPYSYCLQSKNVQPLHGSHTDCFIVSGSKVLEGMGRYVIVAVGTKSFNGRIMMGTFSPRSMWQISSGV